MSNDTITIKEDQEDQLTPEQIMHLNQTREALKSRDHSEMKKIEI